MSSPRPSLRELVKACASVPLIIEACNHRYGLSLTCPIAALVEGRYPNEVTEQEAWEVEQFTRYIVENLEEQGLRPNLTAARRADSRRTPPSRQPASTSRSGRGRRRR